MFPIFPVDMKTIITFLYVEQSGAFLDMVRFGGHDLRASYSKFRICVRRVAEADFMTSDGNDEIIFVKLIAEDLDLISTCTWAIKGERRILVCSSLAGGIAGITLSYEE